MAYGLNTARLREEVKRNLDTAIRQFKGRISLFRTEMGDSGFAYFCQQLAKSGGYGSLSSLELDECGLTDASAPALCEIIRNAPLLRKLQIQDNRFSGEGLKQIVEALEARGIVEALYLNGNRRAGPELGDSLAQLISHNGNLRLLAASKMGLGDEGMRPVLQAAGNSPHLRCLYLSENNATPAIADDAVGMLRQNPNLTRVGIVQGDMALHERLIAPLLEMDRPNLLAFFPTSDACKQLTDHNTDMARKALKLLDSDPESLTFAQKSFVNTRLPAALSLTPNTMRRDMLANTFEAHLDALPKLPRPGDPQPGGGGYGKALFATDTTGYAPLDNPRLWQSPEQAEEVLSHTPLTHALQQSRTAHGGSILESVAMVIPAARLLEILHEKGIKLGAAALLDAEGKPNALFQTWIDDGSATALFTVKNWFGQSPAELTKVHAALPPEIREEIAISVLRQSMTPQTARGR